MHLRVRKGNRRLGLSRCAVSVVDTLVSLDRSLQEGVLEWLAPVRLQPHEIEIVLPIKEETVDAVMLVPREPVQQRTAEPMAELPESPGETVEAVTWVPRERVQQRTAEKIGEVPETACQDWRFQRTVEQAFVDRAEADKITLRDRFEEMWEQHGVNKVDKILKIFLQEQGITEVPQTASQYRRLQRTVEQSWSGRTGEARRKERGSGE